MAVGEATRAGAFGGARLLPTRIEPVADGVKSEGQQVHAGKQHGQERLAMAEVMLHMIAIVFQDVETAILDLPAGAATGGQASPATWAEETANGVTKVLR